MNILQVNPMRNSMNIGDLRAGNREGGTPEDKVSSRAYVVSH